MEDLEGRLTNFILAHWGEGSALGGLRPADGHAGLTYLFEVRQDGCVAGYVLKLAPFGVRRAGNTDVYRQAPLLRALHQDALPVPAVPWAGEDESWFGVPYLVMKRLPGRVYNYWDPEDSAAGAQDARNRWRLAAELLPRFHRYDWRAKLQTWQTPEPLTEQVRRWSPVYRKAPESAWIEAAQRVEQLLLGSMPQEYSVGLVHGDYQPGNLLYLDDRVSGVVDWELAGIGAQLLDLGWLMMKSVDRSGWSTAARAIDPLSVEEMRDIYEHAMGRSMPSIPWFRALAEFRMGSIACFNVRLHRKGQRHDPIWEEVAKGIPEIFERALAILSELGRRQPRHLSRGS